MAEGGNDKLRRAYDAIGELLNEAAMLFKPGVKITFIARRPGQPDQDFVMTADDLEEAIAALRRRQAADCEEVSQ